MAGAAESAYHYLFGPVPSRRLGRSLGVDLVPLKTCSFNCVYCQLGPTAHPTTKRDDYAPADAIVEELKRWLEESGEADRITLAGSGEPTLHKDLQKIVRAVQDLLASHARAYPEKPALRSAILTNGSLLHLPEVREALLPLDMVKVTLSAGDAITWQRLHRPAADLTLEKVIQGLQRFRAAYTGEIWLEVMLLQGINTDPAQVRLIAEMCKDVRPDRVQLNTCVRPPAEADARPVSPEDMRAFAQYFRPPAEVVASFTGGALHDFEADEAAILALVSRHPATVTEIAGFFGQSHPVILKHLEHLGAKGKVIVERQGDRVFYRSPDATNATTS